MPTEARAGRAAALEAKKRRLEDLKARRTDRNVASTSTVQTAVLASKKGDLDKYIDGLLNAPPPGASSESPTVLSSPNNLAEVTNNLKQVKLAPREDEVLQPVMSENKNSNDNNTPIPPVKNIETFAMGTQTENEDFPVSIPEDNNEDEDEMNSSEEEKEESQEEEKWEEDKSAIAPAKLLSPEQVNQEVSTAQFSTFFTSASKKVERLLGASILSDLLVDDTTYYTDQESKRNDSASTKDQRHTLVSSQISFTFPKWTAGRSLTSLDWSPHHRGELMLASYHMPISSSPSITNASASTVVPSLNPKKALASSLQPRSKAEMTNADGLAILWNLTMPSRPEHIFTCGSPVLNAKFHPAEATLVIGACHSGQVVVWDVRSGRLPVQRSSLNIFGSGSVKNAADGHVHPIVGMELLDGGSALVTASSDGKVNFWSLSNLRDPAETMMVNGNISALTVAPESQSLLVGDESGGMHCIVSSSSASGRSSTARRTSRKLRDDEDELTELRHFGMVTGLSTRTMSKTGSSNSVSLSRGFVRGASGLVLSCGIDWTTKLWAPAYSDKPLMNLLSHSYDYMCDVQWSPVHPSIFATASSNGTLGIWNLASSLDEPMTGVDGFKVDGGSASSYGLNKIKWSHDGRRIIAASWDTLHVFGMSEDVWKAKGDEESRMMNNLKGRGLLFEE